MKFFINRILNVKEEKAKGRIKRGKKKKGTSEIIELQRNLITHCLVISVLPKRQNRKWNTGFTVAQMEIKAIKKSEIKTIFWLYIGISFQLASDT